LDERRRLVVSSLAQNTYQASDSIDPIYLQEKLAEKADVHPTYIGKIERGDMNPSVVFLEKIAKAFNISLPELLAFPDDKKLTNATAQDINKLITFLNDAIDVAKRYKAD
jgi:transcriptional regulator with XRE-family HTH domain